MNTRSLIVYLLAPAWIIGVPLSSPAANLVVTNRFDSAAGSLRTAVTTANANPDADLITFDLALTRHAIGLNSQIVLSNRVTIDASGLPDGIPIYRNSGERLFELAENAVVELNHLTMLGGRTTNIGGAILVNANSGALTLNHCTLAHNSARVDGGAIAGLNSINFVVTLNNCTVAYNVADRDGGGISTSGPLTVNNCTFSHNTARENGGAINGGTVTVNGSSIHNNFARAQGGGLFGNVIANNSTIANNRAMSRGGGVYMGAEKCLLTNCTISGNVAFNLSGGGGIHGSAAVSAWVNTIVAGNIAPMNANFPFPTGVVSNSLTNGDPRLAPLGDYGGPTLTMPPLVGSPAIDAGDDSVTNSLAVDQRGYRRLGGAHVDIGAVERQIVNATNAPVLKLSFTSSPDTDFTVLATTNVALPVAQWSILGRPTQNPPAEYQFTDILASEYPQRFYKVTSP